MFLIAGLGNPGEKYFLNRHNIGFLVIDKMAQNLQTTAINKSNFSAHVLKSKDLLLVKPLTFMNHSGQSIEAISHYYKIPLENIIVIHDDLDLPFGTIKFKKGGGHGGHNGLRSIDAHLGKEYIRIRVGIGKPQEKEDVIKHVLGDFNKEELNKLHSIIDHCIDASQALQKLSLNHVKSQFTQKIE